MRTILAILLTLTVVPCLPDREAQAGGHQHGVAIIAASNRGVGHVGFSHPVGSGFRGYGNFGRGFYGVGSFYGGYAGFPYAGLSASLYGYGNPYYGASYGAGYYGTPALPYPPAPAPPQLLGTPLLGDTKVEETTVTTYRTYTIPAGR